MTWSWWYTLILLPLVAMIFVIVKASGWQPNRPSLPSVPRIGSWGKAISAIALTLLSIWWVDRVPGDAFVAYPLLLCILCTMYWRQFFRFLGVVVVLSVIFTMGSCFLTCGRIVGKMHTEYETEVAQKEKERRERFPIAGKGTATDTEPVRAWIDPLVTHGRGSGPVKYVLAKDQSQVYFGSGRAGARWPMSVAGSYFVFPQEGKTVTYAWWQGNSPPGKEKKGH